MGKHRNGQERRCITQLWPRHCCLLKVNSPQTRWPMRVTLALLLGVWMIFGTCELRKADWCETMICVSLSVSVFLRLSPCPRLFLSDFITSKWATRGFAVLEAMYLDVLFALCSRNLFPHKREEGRRRSPRKQAQNKTSLEHFQYSEGSLGRSDTMLSSLFMKTKGRARLRGGNESGAMLQENF